MNEFVFMGIVVAALLLIVSAILAVTAWLDAREDRRKWDGLDGRRQKERRKHARRREAFVQRRKDFKKRAFIEEFKKNCAAAGKRFHTMDAFDAFAASNAKQGEKS